MTPATAKEIQEFAIIGMLVSVFFCVVCSDVLWGKVLLKKTRTVVLNVCSPVAGVCFVTVWYYVALLVAR